MEGGGGGRCPGCDSVALSKQNPEFPQAVIRGKIHKEGMQATGMARVKVAKSRLLPLFEVETRLHV